MTAVLCCTAALLLQAAGASATQSGAPVVVVNRDNVEITESCRVQVAAEPIADADGNGVVRIVAGGVTVEFADTPLRGAAPAAAPDTYSGTGIVVAARNVTLRGARVHGFKAGIVARRASGLVIEDCDVSDNFRQRLHSTPRAEDPADWLRPHANDNDEWLSEYGAGIYVAVTAGAEIRRNRARHTQNGIVLSRVSQAKVYDNDCAFGSGWGIALWRSSHNTISRNSCDFRVRGYSHGVYNRGQDSAGILMFEQCAENVFTHNSATHCGDGFFGFAGVEAIGREGPRRNESWYRQRGCNENEIANNDFSYAAAHGLELTFSFRNRILYNRLAGNAICGLWGGYSQLSYIAFNTFEDNGGMPYGSERGGINIEHGHGHFISGNAFRSNACGVYLWWDLDREILKLPWAAANPTATEENSLLNNTFEGDAVGIQLERVGPTTLANNSMTDVGVEERIDDISEPVVLRLGSIDVEPARIDPPDPIGETSPVGARAHLAGREHIVMTEWGPYDWTEPLLRCVERAPARHVWELLGPATARGATVWAGVELDRLGAGRYAVFTNRRAAAVPYRLEVATDDGPLAGSDVLLPVEWTVTLFASPADPRREEDAWRAGIAGGVTVTLPALALDFGRGGPGDLGLDEELAGAALPADGFSTVAETEIEFPAGTFTITTTSDDGIRVWLGEQLVIDDWTWHAPRRHSHELTLEKPTVIPIHVEHFELDGHALLKLDIE